MNFKINKNYLISGGFVLIALILIIGVGLGLFSLRIISRNLTWIEGTLNQQQQSINALNNIPANQSSLANANPGYITIKVATDPTAATLGKADAPVKIIEFADFQCPFCEKFFQQSESEIIHEYVDTGKAQFIFENFAFLGNESEEAAEAALCANQQGQFWPYHDYLYEHQAPENSGVLTVSDLEHIASTISGINQSKFNTCLSTHQTAPTVQQQLTNAVNEGISSTPTILINGKEYVGVNPTSSYESAIDAALKASS